MEHRTTYSASAESALATNKVLRNTYTLLAMTFAFSAFTALISMQFDFGFLGRIGFMIAAIVCLFITHKKAETAQGLFWTFAFVGFMGLGLGPLLNHYLAMSNGGEIVMQALGGTALVFFGLSAYALTSKKDFSFMGGFLMVGMIVVVVAMLANLFFQVPGVSLAISAAVVMLMSGLILFDTSRIVHGGETNYIRATVSLYLNIYNLFVHLLALIGMGED